MNGSVIVWDLETVPDLHGFAAANDLVGKTDEEVREAIGDKFPKHIYHSIVCIGALVAHADGDHWAVDALGAPHVGERTEKQLIVKNTFFIDSYVKANLGDLKTTLLVKMREKIAEIIKKQITEGIDKENDAFQSYVKENGLSNSYQRIVRNFLNPPPRPDDEKTLDERLGVGNKSKLLIHGPADHIILLYNSSPSAPAVWKNVRGDILFQNGGASLCFSQSNPDAALVRYIERVLNQLGANRVNHGQDPCELAKVSSSTDVIAFQRGELLKLPESYIGALVRSVEDDRFREYRIVTDYSSTREKLEAFSLQLETEVEANAREGYGVLAVSNAVAVCVITPQQPEKVDGIKALLARDKDLIAPKLIVGWQFVATTADLAYLGLQRQQCGYVSGDANVLRPIMMALRREQKGYGFSPVWFTLDEVSRATFDARDAQNQQILKEQEHQRKIKEDEEIKRLRSVKKENQKSEVEARLREQYGVRARSLKDEIHRAVKDLAERRRTDGEGRFPTYTNWLRGRFADQWETFEVTTEIDDFGSVKWKGRLLDGIVVKTIVQQKNRVKGEYGDDCFVFGLVDDAEFSMQREMFGEACANSEQLVRKWKIANQFESLWNAERRGEAGSREVLATAAEGARAESPGNRSVAVKPDVQGGVVATATAPDDPTIKALDQAIAANPDDAAAFSRRGQLFVLRGNFPLAIRDFNEVLRLRPKDPEAFNNRCWANAILGDFRTALHDCDEALAVRPSYADALARRHHSQSPPGQYRRRVRGFGNPLIAVEDPVSGQNVQKKDRRSAAAGPIERHLSSIFQAKMRSAYRAFDDIRQHQ